MNIQNTSFHYFGKDKRGVSKWRGSYHLLKWLGVGFVFYGGAAGIACLGMLLYALFTLSWPIAFHTLVMIAAIHCLTFGGIGLWALKMHRHIQSLQTPDKVSARFGLDEATLTQMAEEKGIKPRMNLNGVDYYRPEDFAENAFTLLRGTTRPADSQEVLLRAAATHAPTPPEELLRVSETSASTQANSVHVATEARSEAEVQQARVQ